MVGCGVQWDAFLVFGSRWGISWGQDQLRQHAQLCVFARARLRPVVLDVMSVLTYAVAARRLLEPPWPAKILPTKFKTMQRHHNIIMNTLASFSGYPWIFLVNAGISWARILDNVHTLRCHNPRCGANPARMIYIIAIAFTLFATQERVVTDVGNEELDRWSLNQPPSHDR